MQNKGEKNCFPNLPQSLPWPQSPSKVSRESEEGKAHGGRRKQGERGGLTAVVPKSKQATGSSELQALGRREGGRAGGRERWSPAAWCQPSARRGGPPAVPSSGTPSRPLPAGLSRPPWHRAAEGAGSSPCSEPLFFFSTPPSSSSSGCYIMSGCSWKPDGSDVTLGKGGGKLEGVEVPLPSPPCH